MGYLPCQGKTTAELAALGQADRLSSAEGQKEIIRHTPDYENIMIDATMVRIGQTSLDVAEDYKMYLSN